MALVGKIPTIKNLVLTTQDVEYSYLLPVGTKKFTIRCRTDDELKLAYAKEQSGTEYINIPEGADHFEDGINTGELTMYLQSPTAGVVVEIVSWAT